MAPSIISATGVTKRVLGPEGPLTIVDKVDLAVAAGEAVAIYGPSGSGKSTLLGLLAGLDRASSGQVALFGQDLTDLDEDGRAALRLGQVGFVFQSFQLLPGLTALENVLLPLELLNGSRAGEAAAAILDQVGLADRKQHYPLQLSGGEQQRVAIARAFVTQPRLLFADEPTGNLDRGSGERVAAALFRLRAEHNTALVLVTHDQALASRCDRTYAMDAGGLIPT